MSQLKRVEEEMSSFILFGGMMTREDRQKLAKMLYLYLLDPNYPVLFHYEQSGIAERFPNWDKLLQRLFLEDKLVHLTRNNDDFSLSVTRETLNWCKTVALRFEHAHSYAEEEQRLNHLKEHTAQSPLNQWESVLIELPQLHPEAQRNWLFYAKTFQELSQTISPSGAGTNRFRQENDLMVLKQNILNDWEHLLTSKIAIEEEAFLEEEFALYHADMLNKAGRLQEINDVLAPFYNFLGHAWNDDMGAWDKINWNKMEEYAEGLRRDRQLRELADLLGRWQSAERSRKEQKLSQPMPKSDWKPNPYGKSEIVGIHHSNHISAMLPSETALLSSPETEIMLAKKYVERKLLTFQYRSQDISDELEEREVIAYEDEKEKRGPMIMLIDTSGSMFGQPERIAKALALAILNIAIEEDRKAYVISFSVGFRTLELTGKKGQISVLIDFLQQSFHGGTELHPGMNEVMKVLQREGYREADVLVISDFVVPRLDKDLFNAVMEARKTYGTNFHSMYITRRPDPRVPPLPIFDNHWIYDLDNPGIIRQTIDHFQVFR